MPAMTVTSSSKTVLSIIIPPKRRVEVIDEPSLVIGVLFVRQVSHVSQNVLTLVSADGQYASALSAFIV